MVCFECVLLLTLDFGFWLDFGFGFLRFLGWGWALILVFDVLFRVEVFGMA